MKTEETTDACSASRSTAGLAVVLPKEPPLGLLMSMALRYDHGLGCPGYYDTMPTYNGETHAKRLEATITTMRQLYEEVSGYGFYRPDCEEEYAAMVTANAEVRGAVQ